MLYAILAPLGFGISNSLSKITGTALGPTRAIILQNIFIILTLISLALVLGGFESFNPTWVLVSALIGVFGYFGFAFFIRAVTSGKIGLVIPIIDLAVVVSSVNTLIFLGQHISLTGIFFMILILLGAVLLSININDWRNSNIFNIKSGVPFAVIASVIWGTEYFLRTFPISHIGAINTALIIEISVMCTALIHLLLIDRQKLLEKINIQVLKYGFLVGIFASIGNLGINFGLATVGGPLTFAILGTRPAVSSLVAYFVFREKLQRDQIFAMSLVAIGVVGVSLYK